jgi:hypothetical protein
MSISVTPILPVIAAESAAPDLLLQPGSVVDALVLKILSDDLVRIAIANVSIDVLSEIPLAVGQSLQLAVSQTQDGIRLAVVGQGAASATSADTTSVLPNPVIEAAGAPANPSAVALPSRNVLTPLERVAVSTAAEIAATQQQSLAPLFANLGAVAGAANFPAKLQQAVAQVLAQRTNLDPELTGVEVKSAFQKSGLFLEAALASQSVLPASGIPDLKAALIVLRQTLAASLGSAATTESPATPLAAAPQTAVPGIANPSAVEAANPQPTQPSPALVASSSPALVPSQSPEIDADVLLPPQAQAASQAPALDDVLPPGSAAARIVRSASPLNAASRAVASDAVLNLLEETLQPTARVIAASLLPVAALQNDRGDVTFHTNTPPPPFRGGLPSSQPIVEPSIASGAPLATNAHRLLGDTDAAIARQTLLQVASLPDRVDTPGVQSDPITPRWHFEIPFATPQGTAMAQFEISQQGGGNDVEAAKRVWRARFSLDVEPAGPVHALISLTGERTSVRMWAERPATAAQLRAGAAQLSQALSKAELRPGDIVIRDGVPPQPAPLRAGHFLDRAL